MQKTPRITGRRLQERNRIWLGMHPVCAACGKQAAREVDHIIPLFRGGADDWSNIQGLCVECHVQKTARDLGRKPRAPKGCDASGIPLARSHHWNK
jgi:5-methylcytosine-specific restriction enzyme A